VTRMPWLMESASEHPPLVRSRRCMVHFYQNVFGHVPSTTVREVSYMLKAIHALESRPPGGGRLEPSQLS
jgi:Transposase, Mutator family